MLGQPSPKRASEETGCCGGCIGHYLLWSHVLTAIPHVDRRLCHQCTSAQEGSVHACNVGACNGERGAATPLCTGTIGHQHWGHRGHDRCTKLWSHCTHGRVVSCLTGRAAHSALPVGWRPQAGRRGTGRHGICQRWAAAEVQVGPLIVGLIARASAVAIAARILVFHHAELIHLLASNPPKAIEYTVD
jgi:hypothetical protein